MWSFVLLLKFVMTTVTDQKREHLSQPERGDMSQNQLKKIDLKHEGKKIKIYSSVMGKMDVKIRHSNKVRATLG